MEIADRIIVLSDADIVGEHMNQNLDLKQIISEVAGMGGQLGIKKQANG